MPPATFAAADTNKQLTKSPPGDARSAKHTAFFGKRRMNRRQAVCAHLTGH
jgi:hypothetical protein